MKIRYKISLVFIAQFLIAFSILTILVSFFTYNVSREENISHLETAAEGRMDHLSSYLQELKNKLNLSINRVGLKSSIYALTQEGNIEEKEKIKEKIKENLLEYLTLVPNVQKICTFDTSGNILISVTPDPNSNCNSNLFLPKALDDYQIKFLEENGEIKIFVQGPISHNNKLLGTGMFTVNLGELNKIVTNRTGLGETGEILVAILGNDGNPIFLNEKRFKTIKTTKQTVPLAEPMKIALAGVNGSFHSQYDYVGNKVMTVTRYLEEYELGITAKINENESLSTVKNIIFFFIGLIVFFVIASFALTNIFIKKLTKPIELLQQGIKTVEAGNLGYSIKTGSTDEIGDLANAFNRMTDGIKKSQANVHKKVQEQTEEIQKRSSEINDQQKAVLNILEDVDEEKHNAEKEKEKLNKILYSIGDGVFVVDKKKRITMYNEAAAKISGYSSSEAIGKDYRNILKFAHEKTGKSSGQFINEALKTGKTQEVSKGLILTNREDKKISVSNSAAPLTGREGKVNGCVVVFRDVTKEREVDRAKTEFVSLASHQLRTPLSAINWYTEMLIDGDAGKLNEEQEEYLTEIYKGNQRMVDLVNALLDVSRIELGTFSIEPSIVNLGEIMQINVNEVQNKIDSKKQKFSSTVDKATKKYLGDTKLLNIIFQNLISNAVKYTPEKGKINVEIKKKAENIIITVTDTGMGIPLEQHDKVFSKLFRADNVRETDTEGTGLGLYIVKSIVDQSGGTVSFQSKKNKGTKFIVTLPASGMTKKTGTKKLGS